MSTEAPIVETPPVIPPQPQAEPSQSLLANLRITGHPSAGPAQEPAIEPIISTEPTPSEEPKQTPEPAKEPAKEPEPAPKPKDEPTVGMSEKAAIKFKTLEKHKVQAEQERDTARKELETIKAEAETLRKAASELEDARKEAQRAAEEVKTYREQIRALDIERDPEFQRQYNGEILTRQEQMLEMVVSSGGSREEFIRAINSGDEDAIEAFRDSLPPAKQRLWDTNRIDIERLAFSKKEALRDSKKTYEQLEQDRKRQSEAAAERLRMDNVSQVHNIVDSLKRSVPDLDKAGAEAFEEVETWLKKVVTEAPREFLIEQLAVGSIAQLTTEAQKGEIDRLNGEVASRDSQIEELTEKLAEQETFIKNASSHVPRGGRGTESSGATENGSLLSQVRVRLPGK